MKIDEAYQQTLSYFFYISIQGRGTKYNIKLFKLFKRKASEPKEKFELFSERVLFSGFINGVFNNKKKKKPTVLRY